MPDSFLFTKLSLTFYLLNKSASIPYKVGTNVNQLWHRSFRHYHMPKKRKKPWNN